MTKQEAADVQAKFDDLSTLAKSRGASGVLITMPLAERERIEAALRFGFDVTEFVSFGSSELSQSANLTSMTWNGQLFHIVSADVPVPVYAFFWQADQLVSPKRHGVITTHSDGSTTIG